MTTPRNFRLAADSTTGSCPTSRNQSFSLTEVRGSSGVAKGISVTRSAAITRFESSRSGKDSLMSWMSTTPRSLPSSSPT